MFDYPGLTLALLITAVGVVLEALVAVSAYIDIRSTGREDRAGQHIANTALQLISFRLIIALVLFLFALNTRLSILALNSTLLHRLRNFQGRHHFTAPQVRAFVLYCIAEVCIWCMALWGRYRRKQWNKRFGQQETQDTRDG